MKKDKPIYTICLECGNKYGKKNKSIFGIWTDNCQICKKKKVPCASASHDFGIYSTQAQLLHDIIQYQI